MRRLLFNPLAQQPYASGELDKIKGQFVLDKALEKGHIYIARVFNTDAEEVSTTILDLPATKYTYTMAPIIVSDMNGNSTLYVLSSSNDTPSCVDFVTAEGSPYPTNNSFAIYLYKLF